MFSLLPYLSFLFCQFLHFHCLFCKSLLTSYLLLSSYLLFSYLLSSRFPLLSQLLGFRFPADLPVFFEHARCWPCHCAQGYRVKTSSLTYPFLFSVLFLFILFICWNLKSTCDCKAFTALLSLFGTPCKD